MGAYLAMLGAVTAVRASPTRRRRSATGWRAWAPRLGAVLGELVADHPTVTIHTLSGDHVEGELRSSGFPTWCPCAPARPPPTCRSKR
ncbi:MAG: hypothetical protein R2746_00860 [Acidimicrobiales bacterium]